MWDFIYSLMTDKRNGGVFKILKAILRVASVLYGLGMVVRTLLYKYKIFEIHSVPMKIISVGNITLGGTGKTPFVVELTRIFREEFRKEPAVLIRGYGWDESAMLKAKLKDTPILVGEERARSARRAIKLYGSDTAILDDGFQHWELGRNLDIVLVDSRNPFGNGCLFPRGVLRERKSSLKRADIVVLTKVNFGTGDTEQLKAEIWKIRGDIEILEAVHRPRHFYDTKQRKDVDLSRVSGKRVMLLSSIGDPEYFEDTVKGLGAVVVEHIAFGDHHNYSESDKSRIIKRCSERAFDLIVTTERKRCCKTGKDEYNLFGSYRSCSSYSYRYNKRQGGLDWQTT
ncbi:MAG: tetraacyldisaccharide 4'-kinase [Candidatus Omnitrophica bacterium]|nr:tetraacyldisaccharide 4'-kinase [Candidatus Omnitrophota bacterium]